MSQLKVNQIDSKTIGTPLVILSPLTVSDSTLSTTPISGSITTNGGLGVVGSANIGGVLNVSSGLISTTTGTGSITTKGGIGVVGSANIGGSATIAGGATISGSATIAGGATISDGATINGTVEIHTSPAADISLRVYEDADTPNYMRLRPSANGTRQQGFLFSNNGDTTVLAVDTKQLRVGVGTSSPTVQLDVIGSIKASTSLVLGSATMTAPSGTAPIFGARAYAYIPTSVPSGTRPPYSGNVASITRMSTKVTKVTFLTPMPHASYTVVGMGRYTTTLNNAPNLFITPAYIDNTTVYTNTANEMYYTIWDNSSDNTAYNNISDASFVIYC